ncbi:hypothetical protein HanXRQr2_Chr04g0152191 [Helianthus annuus]|uniref:Uncharacterized protein n=1 Tax=Helianthus annuus TaxID=4232 RepID=A0A251UWQ2_HELAN|nr:hypothetical protein HanXRQr2_Chr04g0152191 [Helianthus annuus]KAJ0930196.1 hypothetical protein HanPSC8_Chr04g0146551 [Helianthus annuus]
MEIGCSEYTFIVYTFDDSRSHYPSTTPSRTLYYDAHQFLSEIRWIHSINQPVFEDEGIN